jgi:hypothetical protein
MIMNTTITIATIGTIAMAALENTIIRAIRDTPTKIIPISAMTAFCKGFNDFKKSFLVIIIRPLFLLLSLLAGGLSIPLS